MLALVASPDGKKTAAVSRMAGRENEQRWPQEEW